MIFSSGSACCFYFCVFCFMGLGLGTVQSCSVFIISSQAGLCPSHFICLFVFLVLNVIKLQLHQTALLLLTQFACISMVIFSPPSLLLDCFQLICVLHLVLPSFCSCSSRWPFVCIYACMHACVYVHVDMRICICLCT